MRFLVADRRIPLRLATGILLLGIAGCQSGGGGFLGMGERATSKPTEDLARITDAELRGFCPRVVVREHTAVLNSYQRGGDGDPEKLVYQASVSDYTRSCDYGNGMLTLNVALAGRVVPGPVGAAGANTVPIKIVVLRDEEVLSEQVYQQNVTIADVHSAAQFVFNAPAITIPAPTTRNVIIFAGFDVPDPVTATDDDALGL